MSTLIRLKLHLANKHAKARAATLYDTITGSADVVWLPLWEAES